MISASFHISNWPIRVSELALVKWLLLIAAIVLSTEAIAFTNCEIDGKVVNQNAPCFDESAEQGKISKERYEALYKRLDQLQKKGVGWVERPTTKYEPEPAVDSASSGDGYFVPKSRVEMMAERDRQFEEHARKAQQRNQESSARLANILDEAERRCGGKLYDYPEVGMSDETFRKCTIHARMGDIVQIIVDKYESIPLKLYVFSSSQAQRVYVVNGVITVIKP